MMQDKTLYRKSSDSKAREQKRLRLSPPKAPQVSAALPPLPPLRNFTQHKASPTAAPSNGHKLAELRRRYLADISMVAQELKAVLTYGPGTACPDTPEPASVALKLVRTIQTLEKLRTLLLMNPTRLRRVSLAQLETVEQQLKMNLLPLATLFRSFEGQDETSTTGNGIAKTEDWSHECDTKSPRSPSGVPVVPRRDWRFLSMALSLQL